jgi:hypothetical protein
VSLGKTTFSNPDHRRPAPNQPSHLQRIRSISNLVSQREFRTIGSLIGSVTSSLNFRSAKKKTSSSCVFHRWSTRFERASNQLDSYHRGHRLSEVLLVAKNIYYSRIFFPRHLLTPEQDRWKEARGRSSTIVSVLRAEVSWSAQGSKCLLYFAATTMVT